MPIELKIPEVGESITEAQIGKWLKDEGDHVEKDEPVVELESDKASLELPAPASGTLSKQLKKKGETAEVGEVIGYIEKHGDAEGEKNEDTEKQPKKKKQKKRKSDEEDKGEAKGKKERQEEDAEEAEDEAEGEGKEKPEDEEEVADDKKKRKAQKADEEEPEEEEQAEDEDEEGEEDEEDRKDEAQTKQPRSQVAVEPRVMPAARRALEEHRLEADEVEATGPGGRLLKEDVLRHVQESPPEDKADRPAAKEAAAKLPRPAVDEGDEREEQVVPMSPIRKRIAQRLVEAQHQAALLTTFNEVDMSAVLDLRKRHQESFEKRHGVRLGFMAFFVKAAIDALRQFPGVNAEVRDDDIVYRNYYDIGIAISTERGLVVPVIRDAHRLSFADVESAINELAERARANRIKLEELRGGTFTITNGGVFGSLLSTPIVNPPQSGILGMHTIQERPVVRDGAIVVRPMMYVALTYDHRVVDGREAVLCLRRICEAIEEPARMLIEV